MASTKQRESSVKTSLKQRESSVKTALKQRQNSVETGPVAPFFIELQ